MVLDFVVFGNPVQVRVANDDLVLSLEEQLYNSVILL